MASEVNDLLLPQISLPLLCESKNVATLPNLTIVLCGPNENITFRSNNVKLVPGPSIDCQNRLDYYTDTPSQIRPAPATCTYSLSPGTNERTGPLPPPHPPHSQLRAHTDLGVWGRNFVHGKTNKQTNTHDQRKLVPFGLRVS